MCTYLLMNKPTLLKIIKYVIVQITIDYLRKLKSTINRHDGPGHLRGQI